jgi:hypothetical protein
MDGGLESPCLTDLPYLTVQKGLGQLETGNFYDARRLVYSRSSHAALVPKEGVVLRQEASVEASI